MKHKLIFTPLGVELANEIKGEYQIDKVQEQEKKIKIQRKLQKLNDQSSQYIETILQTHINTDINDEMAKKITISSSQPLSTKNIKAMSKIMLADLSQQNQKKDFVQQQALKFSKELFFFNSQKGIDRKKKSDSNILSSPYLNNLSTRNNNQLNNLQSYSIHENDDQSLIKKYNQILNAENKIDKIFKRYDDYQIKHNEIKQKIKEQQLITKQSLHVQQTQKMNINTELAVDNQEALDILFRETKFKIRQQHRYAQYFDIKYSDSWHNLKLPKLPRKYQQNTQEAIQKRGKIKKNTIKNNQNQVNQAQNAQISFNAALTESKNVSSYFDRQDVN